MGIAKIFLCLLLSILAVPSFAAVTRTIDADTIKSADHSKTYTLPASTQTIPGLNDSVTFTNKTLDAGSNTITGILKSTTNTQSGTTYTFALSDGQNAVGNTVVKFTSSSAITATIPPNSSVAFAVGDWICASQLGTGKLTWAQGSGVTIQSASSNKSAGAQYVMNCANKEATDTWTLYGNLIP